MKPDQYYTVTTEFSANHRDRGSKFLGFLLPAATREETSRQLKMMQARFPDATHHCYAWRLLEDTLHEYSADAGEPSGTAGAPILNVLREASLVNILLVVVRYYGGTKLGKPGLTGAYSGTASSCTASADLVPVMKAAGFRITLPYPMKRIIGSLLHKYAIIEAGSEFTDTVQMDVWCPIEHAVDFLNELSGMEHLGVGFDKLGNRIMPVN